MKLYNLKPITKIYADCSDGSKFFTFLRPDGMYSYCKTEKGNVIHLAMATPLLKYRDGYKIITTTN